MVYEKMCYTRGHVINWSNYAGVCYGGVCYGGVCYDRVCYGGVYYAGVCHQVHWHAVRECIQHMRHNGAPLASPLVFQGYCLQRLARQERPSGRETDGLFLGGEFGEGPFGGAKGALGDHHD